MSVKAKWRFELFGVFVASFGMSLRSPCLRGVVNPPGGDHDGGGGLGRVKVIDGTVVSAWQGVVSDGPGKPAVCFYSDFLGGRDGRDGGGGTKKRGWRVNQDEGG